jgi:pyruvate ferredoxin oxidoreductase delta subunit
MATEAKARVESPVRPGEERLASIEVVYRGIFQKTLAQRITRGVVLASRRRGHTGTAFSRYGDSPERNGVPAKQFAVIAPTDLELEAGMAKYEPAVVDVSVAVDDTLVKGVESWAWYGRQPIWKPVRADGFVLVTSLKTPEEILAQTDAAERPYTLAVVPSDPSFAGLWVFKDDHTDYRVLGALARLIPEWLRIEDVKAAILEATSDETKVASAQFGYDRVQLRTVQPGEGTTGHEKLQFEKPGWTTMREGIVVEARKPGERNPFYKKYTARTLRPVVNFDTCIKCTMCWLDCPDECFEVTPSGHYEVVYEACIGCGICAQVCPVKDCIVMIDELNFTDNVDKFALYEQKPDEYRQWFTQMTGLPMPTPAPSAPAATGGE